MEITPVAVIILTYNEEVNIRSCLESVKDFTGEIFIVDSFSTDKTLEIAREYTAKIYQNPWVDWACQRNWALDNLPLAADWVLFLDADERLSPELGQEIVEALNREVPRVDGFYIKRNFYFLGKWLKHAGYQADYVLRLVKKNRARSLGSGAREYVTVQGPIGQLKSPMIHEDKKDLTFWINKQNRLASLEALETLGLEANPEATGVMGKWQSGENRRVEHRWQIWLREKVWARMPKFVRPLCYFFYRYFFQLGFLDGKEGLIYCFLHGLWYPFLIDAKYLELKRRRASSGTNEPSK